MNLPPPHPVAKNWDQAVVMVELPTQRRSQDGAISRAGGNAASDQTSTRKRRKYDITFKGVYACKVSGGNFWQAQISILGNTHHLGVFPSPEDAARAYDEQARPLGRKLNFPGELPRAGSCPPPLTHRPQAKLPKAAPEPIPASQAPQTTAPAEGGSFWSGPCWVNDLDEEKVAAFWRGSNSSGNSSGDDAVAVGFHALGMPSSGMPGGLRPTSATWSSSIPAAAQAPPDLRPAVSEYSRFNPIMAALIAKSAAMAEEPCAPMSASRPSLGRYESGALSAAGDHL